MQITDWYSCYKRGWGGLMANPDAFAHPAKNARNLARRIYEHALERGYFKRGDTVLDPFAGVGGFAFHAMRFGFHFVGVELEQRFVDYASGYDCPGFGKAFFRRFWHRLDRLNYEAFHLCPACVRALKVDDFGGAVPSQEPHRYQGNVELWNERYAAHFPRWGSAVIVQGDSRRLGEVLAGGAGGTVSSPPYSSISPPTISPEEAAKKTAIQRAKGSKRTWGTAMTNPDGSVYSQNPHNLGNLPTGELDAALAAGCVSSPPWIQSGGGEKGIVTNGYGDGSDRVGDRSYAKHTKGLTPGQLVALPSGTVEAAVTSPPYAASTASDDPNKRGGLFRDPKRRGDKTLTATYDESEGQLGAMASGDYTGAISSPPYLENITNIGAVGDTPALRQQIHNSSPRPQSYGITNGQLGNQSQNTFWTAARQIIEQLYQVLMPGAYAAFVVKSFVRDKRIVDFPKQWRQLCEACGFETVEIVRAWLIEERPAQLGLFGDVQKNTIKRASFFRRLHERKVQAAEYWKTLNRHDKARWLWPARADCWTSYYAQLDDPKRRRNARKPHTKGIVDNAQVMAYLDAGEPDVGVETIDYEVVLWMRKRSIHSNAK